LSGGIKEKIICLKRKIISLSASIEAPMDFPDQGLKEINREEIKQEIKKYQSEIQKLLDTVRYGQLVKEGIYSVILGRVNVGKSSLFNALLKKNRSIVTSYPGTTRDIIEETITLNGFQYNLVDTAGLKEPENMVEKISLKKVNQMMQYSQLFIVMFDASQPLSQYDLELIRKVKKFVKRNIKIIIVENKTDLPQKIDISFLFEQIDKKDFVKISVKKNIGIDILEEKMVDIITSDLNIPGDKLIISNKRQQECLLQAKERLSKLYFQLNEGIQEDFIVMDLQYIASQLARITGECCDEEIIKQLFSKFCIGK
jgi:tRNA modification GTPase